MILTCTDDRLFDAIIIRKTSLNMNIDSDEILK